MEQATNVKLKNFPQNVTRHIIDQLRQSHGKNTKFAKALQNLKRVSKTGNEFNKGMLNNIHSDVNYDIMNAILRGLHTRRKFKRYNNHSNGVTTKVLNFNNKSRVKTNNTGIKVFYNGPREQERKLRMISSSGTKWFYNGPQGQERQVRVRMPNGTDLFYNGPQGQEHLVLMELPNKSKWFFNGPQEQERKVRMKMPNGTDLFYNGPQGQEHLVRMKMPNGIEWFFNGPQGQERKVRMKKPSGTESFFNGPRGQEQLVRIESPKWNQNI